MKKPSDSKLLICSIVRNAERGLRRNIPVMEKLCQQFADYRVVVYENDSTDGTKSLLQQWKERCGKHIHLEMHDTDPTQTIPTKASVPGVDPFFCHKRIDRMAHLRNQYMTAIEGMNFDADYLMLVDLDVAQIYEETVLTCWAKHAPEWDAVTAFGYSMSPKLRRRYHDTFALTLWEDRDKPQTEEMIEANHYRLGGLKVTDEWVKVASAFGGMAIYRYEAVQGLHYAEPALENKDPYVEVRCEHYSLYHQMIQRGHDRIYVNPAMRIKYQDLSLRIIWGGILRKIFGRINKSRSTEK